MRWGKEKATWTGFRRKKGMHILSFVTKEWRGGQCWRSAAGRGFASEGKFKALFLCRKGGEIGEVCCVRRGVMTPDIHWE
jgi:hypothetical protein